MVWSDILGRTSWRFARSVDALNRARVKVNKEVGKLARNVGFVAQHRKLEVDTWRYLRGNGVHLNAVGTDLWSLGLQDWVQRALHFWWGTKV